MACEITSGYDLVCDSQGGVDTWYAFAIANYDTLTYANGEVTALTLLAGTYAYPLNVEMETSSFTDVAVGERTNGAYGRQQTATVVLHGNTAEMIVEIEALCRGRHALIAKLNDGTYELLFMENGAKATDERASGTAFEDMNGNTLTFNGKERTKACKIDAAIVNLLLPPVS